MNALSAHAIEQPWVVEDGNAVADALRAAILQRVPHGLGTAPLARVDLDGQPCIAKPGERGRV